MNAAQAISRALDDYGMTKRKDQAELLGEHQSTWSDCVAGKRDPHLSKVWNWLSHAFWTGVSIRLVLDHARLPPDETSAWAATVTTPSRGGR